MAEPCFPIRVAHGHVAELLEAGRRPHLPAQPAERRDRPSRRSSRTPAPGARRCRTSSGSRRTSRRTADRFLTPILHFRRGPEFVGEALRAALKPLGVPARDGRRGPQGGLRGAGRVPRAPGGSRAPTPWPLLEEHDELGIVLVGRPYNIYDAGVNMDIPAKLRRYYGVNVIPHRLPAPVGQRTPATSHANMFWNYGRKILQAAKVVARAPQPAHHLHDQLQVRARLVHQALHRRGLARAVPGAAVRRAHQRRRRHDPLRGLPGQQGLPALVGPRRPGASSR